MYYATTAAKAIAAFLSVVIASGVLSGVWLTRTELIVSVITGAITYAVPNRGRRAVAGRHESPPTG